MSTYELILDLLYPPTCLGCDTLLIAGTKVPLCPTCQEQWENLRRRRCAVCKRPQSLCACKPDLFRGYSGNIEFLHLVPYEKQTVAGKLILIAKDERLRKLIDFFADQLLDVMTMRGISTDATPMVLTYLPRSSDRARQTGVDQAEELARISDEE